MTGGRTITAAGQSRVPGLRARVTMIVMHHATETPTGTGTGSATVAMNVIVIVTGKLAGTGIVTEKGTEIVTGSQPADAPKTAGTMLSTGAVLCGALCVMAGQHHHLAYILLCALTASLPSISPLLFVCLVCTQECWSRCALLNQFVQQILDRIAVDVNHWYEVQLAQHDLLAQPHPPACDQHRCLRCCSGC